MAKEEIKHEKEYVDAYPCCGICENIRRIGYGLICKKNDDYKEFASPKCASFKYKDTIPLLERLKYQDGL